MRKIAVLILALLVASPTSIAWATTKHHRHATYALGNAKRCRADFVKRTERHKVRGKYVRYVACAYVAPKPILVVSSTTITTPTSPTPSSSPAQTTTTTQPATIRATIDPTFTQDASNPLLVTWTYSASITDGTLPAGTLTLTVTVHNQASSSGGCLINVGASVSGGQCTLSLPSFGQYDVKTAYSGGSSTPATGETETDTISQFSSTTTVGTATIGSSTVNSDNNYVVEVDFPVTVSGPGTPTGSVSATGLTCSTLTSGTATCSETVVQPTSGTTSLSPTISYSGDTNYSSSNGTGTATVPTAPAAQQVNIATTTICKVAASTCTFLSNSDNTINGSAQVTANGTVLHNAGTITFTDASGATLCVATLTDQANATCSAPYSGGSTVDTPVTATYSGSSAAVGDAYVDNYQSSTVTAIHSN